MPSAAAHKVLMTALSAASFFGLAQAVTLRPANAQTAAYAATTQMASASACPAAAAQLTGRSTSDLSPAQVKQVLETAARDLWDGTSHTGLQKGNRLFTICLNQGQLVVQQVPVKGVAEDVETAQKLKVMMERVWEAARILGVADIFETNLQQRGHGARPALVTYGGLAPTSVRASYFKNGRLISLRNTKNALGFDSLQFEFTPTVVHEAIGHGLTGYFCALPQRCHGNQASVITNIVEEVIALTYEYAYGAYLFVQGERSHLKLLGDAGYNDKGYGTTALQILKNNPKYLEVIRNEKRVPREFMADLLEAMLRYPNQEYLKTLASKPAFGNQTDIMAKLMSAPFLSDQDRKRLENTVVQSEWYQYLSHRQGVTPELVESFLRRQQATNQHLPAAPVAITQDNSLPKTAPR